MARANSAEERDGRLRPQPRPPHRLATIDDVARLADVSRQTVSNVIRRQGRWGDETRQRVESAIKTLNYAPHRGASSLRSRRTGLLAHPMPASELDPSNVVAVEFIQALVAASARFGKHVVLSAPQTALEGIDEIINSRRADAFIFANLAAADPRVALAARRRFPFACFGRTDPQMPQAWVDIDNVEAVKMAVRHVTGRGRRRVAFFGFAGDSYWDAERIEGYKLACAEMGQRPLLRLVRDEPAEIEVEADRFMRGPRVPDAIVCGGDVLASALYSAAGRSDIRVGSDIAITGFANSVVGRSLTPRLTSIEIPMEKVAELVVERALREVEHFSDEPGQLVPVSIAEGQSV